MKKNRIYLVKRIVDKAKLSESKDTAGYFTKQQLMELLVILDGISQKDESIEESQNGKK